MAKIRDYNESDDVEPDDAFDDDDDFPDDLTPEQAKAAWERLIAAAEKRGGTRRGRRDPDHPEDVA